MNLVEALVGSMRQFIEDSRNGTPVSRRRFGKGLLSTGAAVGLTIAGVACGACGINPTPTHEPISTATPEPIPTPEATPTPKPENPLPSYGVFFGNATDEKGAKVAEVVMASIPQQAGPDQIFMYHISTPNSKGERAHSVGYFKPNNVAGTHFERGGFSSPQKTIPPRMTADFNQKEMTVMGTDVDICSPNSIPCDTRFALKHVGTGKQAIFDAMQRVITDLSSDQPTTPQKELDFYLPLYKNWP